MKKFYTLLLQCIALLCFTVITGFAQVPEGFNYQAIARDAAGNVLESKDLLVRIAIVSDIGSTVVYWEEEHSVQTNIFGLFTLVLGDPGATRIGGTFGNFDNIDWSVSSMFLRPSIKDGSSAWQVMDPSRIVSVPYALLSKDTESKQQLTLSGDNLLLSDGGSASLTKYINQPNQTITLTGSTLSISGGNSADLSSLANTDNQVLGLTGDNLTLTNSASVSLSKYNSPFLFDADTLYRVDGSLSLGSNKPLGSKLAVVSTDDTSGEPLFEVRRKDGQAVFSVYNNGVEIHVDYPGTKGPSRGGFAIGGFDNAKGPGQDYLTVAPDSIRMFIKEDTAPVGKGPSRGGFAIGGFDVENKGFVSNYFNVSGRDNIDIYNDVAQMLWYPRKEAFLAGRILITSPDDVGLNSTSLGYHSMAKGDFSQAFGNVAKATGDNSTAIGNGAQATGPDSYAFGSGAVASGLRSFAFGSVGLDDSGNPTTFPTTAEGDYSVAFGMGAQSQEKGSMALGIGSLSSGTYSNSIGYYSTAVGSYSLSMGYKSTASGPYSSAIGYLATTGVSATQASAMGAYANATGLRSLSLGYTADATANYSVAIGYDAQSTNTASSAFGYRANANGAYSNAYGFYSNASANYATAIGYYSEASADNSYAIGRQATATGINSFSLGYSSDAIGSTSVSIGYNSQATNTNSVAMGNSAISAGINATSIGYQPQANGEKSISIGSHYSYTYSLLPIFNLGKGESDSKGDFIIRPPVITPIYTSIVYNRANIADGKYSISFGNGNYSNNGGFALGSNNDATAFGSVALGLDNDATNTSAFAAGFKNQATGYYSTALGNNSTAQAYGSFVVGQYNVVGGDVGQWVETDPLFVIGNGLNDTDRNNAMTLYKNGRTIFKGTDAQVGFNDKATYFTYVPGFPFGTFEWRDVMYGIKSYINRSDADVDTYYSGYFYDIGAEGDYAGFYADERSGGAIDVAEYIYDTYGDTEAADVVVADPDKTESVIKSSFAYQESVVGVVSTKPHLTMGMELVIDEATGASLPGVMAARLALAGRVPVKVTDENGPIKPGDALTSSSTPGYAMKWTLLDVSTAKDFEELKKMMAENDRRRNAIIGKALESHNNGKGKVVVLIAM